MRADLDLELLEVLPASADAELCTLFRAALETGRLSPADWLTLRDLREISGHRDFTIQALLLALFSALADGNLCLALAPRSFQRRLLRLGALPEQARAWADRILAEFRPEAYPGLVAQGPGDHAPLVASGPRLFFQRQHAWVGILAARLRERLASQPPDSFPSDRIEAVLQEVMVEDPIRLGGRPAVLGEEQCRALRQALQRPLLIVSGGPGTGKTALVLAILRCFLRLNFAPERILLSAPTGRAARNLSDFLRSNVSDRGPGSPDEGLARVEAATLHRLLGYNPSRGLFARGPDSPLEADLVIIDEVSMVDAILMARLLEALPAPARLILLGDKDQLPSVEAGALLADLIPPAPFSGPHRDALIILRRNYRSQPAILEAAGRINSGDRSVIQELPRREPRHAWPPLEEWRQEGQPSGGCFLIPAEGADPGALQRIARAWVERHFLAPPSERAPSFRDQVARFAGAPEADRQDLLAGLLAVLGRARLLTILRRSPWGSDALNLRLAEFLRPRLDPSGIGAAFAGAPILIVRNDHARRLYNGDLGLLLRQGRELAAFFPAEPRPLCVPLALLPPWEPAWASTVHKAQGSEYAQVLLAVPPRGAEALLTREILYTGITRARSLAVLHGAPAVVEAAVERRVERESGLDLWA